MERPGTPKVTARALASLSYLCVGAWLGVFTSHHLWKLYSPYYDGPLGSFGIILEFGALRLGEPRSSLFVLVSAASFIWAGFSLWRKPGGLRLGALVGTVCLLFLVAGVVGAL
jgi:hypothetical protein